MIAYLNGKIFSLSPTGVILDVQGVGYDVHISVPTFEKLNGKETASLFIYTSVKEDSISLYGFSEREEKNIFELLISVNGIGPKSAMTILSGIQPNDLRNAIESADISRLTAMPGVGKKTAERIVLELRGKLTDSVFSTAGAAPVRGVRSEAILALTTLGYNRSIAEKITKEIAEVSPSITIEDMIKQALRKLS